MKKRHQQFGGPHSHFAAMEAFQKVEMKDDEPIDGYVQRVMELAQDGYPDASVKTIQSALVDAFLKGCKNANAPKLLHFRNQCILTWH